MINENTVWGNWDEIKYKMRDKWGVLTEDDISAFSGNVHQFIEKIANKTGTPRESVERFFDQFETNVGPAGDGAIQSVSAYAHHAADSIQESAERASDSMQKGFSEYAGLVRERPAESLAMCFGTGVLSGLVLNLLLRRR